MLLKCPPVFCCKGGRMCGCVRFHTTCLGRHCLHTNRQVWCTCHQLLGERFPHPQWKMLCFLGQDSLGMQCGQLTAKEILGELSASSSFSVWIPPLGTWRLSGVIALVILSRVAGTKLPLQVERREGEEEGERGTDAQTDGPGRQLCLA